MDQIGEKVRSIIALELQVAAERILPDTQLRNDLGMDSIAALNILFAAEEEFGIESIDPRELVGVATVRDAETMIRTFVARARG